MKYIWLGMTHLSIRFRTDVRLYFLFMFIIHGLLYGILPLCIFIKRTSDIKYFGFFNYRVNYAFVEFMKTFQIPLKVEQCFYLLDYGRILVYHWLECLQLANLVCMISSHNIDMSSPCCHSLLFSYDIQQPYIYCL